MPNPGLILTRWLSIFPFNTPKPPPAPPLAPHISPDTPQHEAEPQKRDLRLRKLGLPRQAISGGDSIYTRQASCLLVSRLPIELRDAIWEYLVGHRTLHLFWHDRDTLRGFICEKQIKCISVTHEVNRGKTIMWGSASHIDEGRIDQNKGFLPLLLTCRAIYFEATRVLYSTSYFDFSDHWPAFQYLPWSVPLTSMCHIAHVSITCHGVPLSSTTADFASWRKMWETLSLLKNLRNLRVEIVAPGNHVQLSREELTEEEDKMLAPMQKISDLLRECDKGVWVLVVPFDECTSGSGVAKSLEKDGWRIHRI